MKIKEVKTFVVDCFRTNWVFVKIVTDEGLYGIGEGTLEYKEPTLVAAIHDLEYGLIGKDPLNTELLWHDNYRDAYWRGGPVFMSALAAVDQALWDLKGKYLNCPVWQLLGGKVRDKVPCYANGWFSRKGQAGSLEPEDFAACAEEEIANMHWKGLKWDPFGSAWRQLTLPEMKRALKCVEKVKEVVGDRCDILIECHGRFDLPCALELARQLEPYGVKWMEEPIIPDALEAYAEFRSRSRVSVSGGERLYSLQQFRTAISMGAFDYLQPDVSHAGGLTEVKKIAALADAQHLPICCHNPSGPVANAATLALAASTPHYFYHETMSQDVAWRREVCDEDVRIEDGFMYVNDRPGLGVDIDEKECAKHPFRATHLRHYVGTLTQIRPDDATSYYSK